MVVVVVVVIFRDPRFLAVVQPAERRGDSVNLVASALEVELELEAEPEEDLALPAVPNKEVEVAACLAAPSPLALSEVLV